MNTVYQAACRKHGMFRMSGETEPIAHCPTCEAEALVIVLGKAKLAYGWTPFKEPKPSPGGPHIRYGRVATLETVTVKDYLEKLNERREAEDPGELASSDSE